MPQGDGFNVAIMIRSLEDEDQRVPILLISGACDDSENQENAKRCGADALLCKPFSRRDLLERVRSLLGH